MASKDVSVVEGANGRKEVCAPSYTAPSRGLTARRLSENGRRTRDV
jgi:hypothetical protein